MNQPEPTHTSLDDPRTRALDGGADIRGELARRLDQPVRVVLTGDDPSWSRQLIALCLVDLLARLVPTLVIDCSPTAQAHPLLPPGPDLLRERLELVRTYAMIDPKPGPLAADAGVTVVVGSEPAGADLYTDGSGWVGYVGQSPGAPLPEDLSNPVGPLLAACRASSQVIQRLLGDMLPASEQIQSSYWSALTYTDSGTPPAQAGPSLKDVNLDAVLMGSGSIGGAAVYTLARTPGVAGELVLVDPDALESRNSLKALLARRTDIEEDAAKVDVAEHELAHHDGLSSAARRETLAQWVAGRPVEYDLPLVLCAVDSIHARRELQDHLPLEVLNAACGDTDITVSGHRTGEGPCVYCLYIDQVLDREAGRAQILARETGLPPGMINELRVKRVPLAVQHLTGIERHRGLLPGSLAAYRGRTLDELFEERILYGEVQIRGSDGERAALVLPFVPAVAGILLAAEALKAGAQEELSSARLGPVGALETKYEESLVHRPTGILSSPPRWSGADHECLCQSTRRATLLRERRGLGG